MDHPVTASLIVVSIPLVEPFRTATTVVDRRTVALVAIGDPGGDGVVGWGEAAPFPGQDEAIDDLLEAAAAGTATPTLAAAIDEAVHDRRARADARDLVAGGRDRVPISVAVGIDGSRRRVDELVARGVGAFKVKVAPGAIRHVADIRAAHPDVVIGVDANGAFRSVDGLLDVLIETRVAYAEELVADDFGGTLDPLAEAGITHFADESVRSIDDARRVLSSERYGGVTIKPGRLGWSGACAVRDLARDAGLPWRASGLLETGLGRAYSDRLASEPDAAVSDVAPAEWFLEAPIVPRIVENGHLLVPDGPGVGVVPDPEAVERYVVARREVTVSRLGPGRAGPTVR